MTAKGKAVILAAAVLTAQTLAVSGACEDSVCYVLREWNGKIALMEEGCDEPLAVYKTPISSLYPADAVLLREGIRLRDGGEVTRLIEDLELE